MTVQRTAIQRDAEQWAKAIREEPPESEAAKRGLVGPDNEDERMRHVPGIVFADGAVGRRARIAGTGIEVFEAIRFLIDENNSAQVAVIGRRLGFDVVHVMDLGRGGYDDESQLGFAASEGRCLVTKNDRDFRGATRRFPSGGDPHSGVLIVAPSLDRRQTARIAHALVAYAAFHPDGLPPSMLDYLHSAPGG